MADSFKAEHFITAKEPPLERAKVCLPQIVMNDNEIIMIAQLSWAKLVPSGGGAACASGIPASLISGFLPKRVNVTRFHRDFSSDNIAPAAPEFLAALEAANHGPVHSYGDDEWTSKLERRARDIFECDLAIYPVATGTAANSLALAALSPPHGGIYCHATAHVEKDECGAPEFFTGGAKLLALPGANGKLTPDAIAPAYEKAQARGVHQVRPAAISISQATEWGTVYKFDEIAAMAQFGQARNLPLHMDGARFGNAMVHLGCTPAQATWRAGVDVLSFGATKNGALAAEAVIFFNKALAHEFEYRRKRGGHLLSKMRFCSAQLLAYLTDGFWLRAAGNANRMAAKLAEGLQRVPGITLTQPVQANELFPSLPESLIDALLAENFGFYRWPSPDGAPGPVIRLVTAWNTTEADIDDLLAVISRHSHQ
jgi:threonine aldolase